MLYDLGWGGCSYSYFDEKGYCDTAQASLELELTI